MSASKNFQRLPKEVIIFQMPEFRKERTCSFSNIASMWLLRVLGFSAKGMHVSHESIYVYYTVQRTWLSLKRVHLETNWTLLSRLTLLWRVWRECMCVSQWNLSELNALSKDRFYLSNCIIQKVSNTLLTSPRSLMCLKRGLLFWQKHICLSHETFQEAKYTFQRKGFSFPTTAFRNTRNTPLTSHRALKVLEESASRLRERHMTFSWKRPWIKRRFQRKVIFL